MSLQTISTLSINRLHLESQPWSGIGPGKCQEWKQTNTAGPGQALDRSLHLMKPPNPRATDEAYKAFINDPDRITRIVESISNDPFPAPAERWAKTQGLLRWFIRNRMFSEAFAILWFQHETSTQPRVRPVIETIDGIRFLTVQQSDKQRNDRRDDVVRYVPVILDISDEELDRCVQEADLVHCIGDAKTYLRDYVGINGTAWNVRHLGATLLLDWLRTPAGANLLHSSPRGWPLLINLALGHTLRSNQFMTYLHQ
jgi:hypothetical protein